MANVDTVQVGAWNCQKYNCLIEQNKEPPTILAHVTHFCAELLEHGDDSSVYMEQMNKSIFYLS